MVRRRTEGGLVGGEGMEAVGHVVRAVGREGPQGTEPATAGLILIIGGRNGATVMFRATNGASSR